MRREGRDPPLPGPPQLFTRLLSRSYYRLAKKFHPDANKNDPKAQEKFQEIRRAYDTLKARHCSTAGRWVGWVLTAVSSTLCKAGPREAEDL